MNKYSIILILAVSIMSCKTPQIVTKIETKWRDTTIVVKIPVYIDKIIEVPLPVHDTLRIVEKVYVDKDGQAEMKPVHKEKGIIGADISITNGKLIANLYLTDSTLFYNYRDTLNYEDSVKIYNAIKETTIDTTITKEKLYVPKFFKFTMWFFILVVLAGAGWILYKFKGGWIKNILKK